jgi:peroxiredoxin
MKNFTLLFLLFFSISIIVVPFQSNAVTGALNIREKVVFSTGKYFFRVGGQPLMMDVTPSYHTEREDFLIPLRAFAELLRYQVTWQHDVQLATIKKDDRVLSLSMLNNQVHSNHELKSNAFFQIKNSRILLDTASIVAFFETPMEVLSEGQEVLFSVKRLEVLMKAADFTLKDLADGDFNLFEAIDDPSIHLVAINFYSTFCPYCIKEIPNLVSFYNDYRDKGVLLIGIDTSTTDTQGRREEILEHHQVSYPILIDLHSKVYDQYRVSGIPNIFLINKDKEIILHHLGIDDRFFLTLYSFVDAYLALD